jgi:class 3 adenylate cyclase
MQETKIMKGLVRQISRSRKPATILFTDIEGSTKYRDRHGDIKGRLLIDRHNRLLFPVIHKFGGRIVKTIGDAIMAAFRQPEDAIYAAVGMQQILEQERDRDRRRFRLHVRIGIHTGQGIVEKKDIFGDVVNVAARVESKARADEILLSGATASRVRNAEFALTSQGSVGVKGKSKPINLFKCNWRKLSSCINDITLSSALPLIGRQKRGFLLYLAPAIAGIYVIYHEYLRYLISDSEERALLALNPMDILGIHPALNAVLGFIAAVFVILIFRMQMISHNSLRIIKGFSGFGVVLLCYLALQYGLSNNWPAASNKVLHSSENLFVEVLQPTTSLYATPSLKAKPLKQVNRGELLLLTDVGAATGLTWNKVLVAKRSYAWVPRVIPAQIGEPEKRITSTNKFYFRMRDVIALIIGFVAFVWGWLDFRIKPA